MKKILIGVLAITVLLIPMSFANGRKEKDNLYNDQTPEIMEFLKEQNKAMPYFVKDKQVDKVKEYKSLKELYNDCTYVHEAFPTYKEYVKFINEQKLLEKEYEKDTIRIEDYKDK